MSSGGGGSSAPTTTTVQQNSLPEFVEPYLKGALDRSVQESYQSYQPYAGQRLSYFSPDELAAQGMARGFYSTAPGGYDVGIGRAAMTSGYQGIPYSNFRLQNYMNPFQQNVTDIQKREAIRRSQQMGSNIMGQAAQAGGLGGYREAIMQAERQRNLAQQLDDIQGKGSLQGFMNAQQQLERDRAERARAAQIALSGATALPGLLDARGRNVQQRIAAASKLGGEARGLRQAGMDIAYQDYLSQRDYPKSQLGFLQSMIRGMPLPMSQTVSTYQQRPSAFAGALGSGLGALGLMRGFG